MRTLIKWQLLFVLVLGVLLSGCATCRRTTPPPQPAATIEGLTQVAIDAPQYVSVGEDFMATVTITARRDCGNIHLMHMMEEDIKYVKSEPKGTVRDGAIHWRFPYMNQGDKITVRVWQRAEKEGPLVSCFTLDASPRVCYRVVGVKPQITIAKVGPETALLGQTITYQIHVKNEGTGVARDVVVIDTIPAGLEHSSGQKEVRYDIGTLAANEKKVVQLSVKAAARGEHRNKAVVETSNAGKAEDHAITRVLVPGVSITKTGPEEQFTTKNAEYTITVKNTGDTTLNNVRVVDTAPAQTRIVEAPGAQVAGQRATWVIPSLEPNAERKLTITLTSDTVGVTENVVTVVTQEGPEEAARAKTTWKGFAAILVELIDINDPIFVGEEEIYVIRVTNQGTKDDTSVKVVAKFPAELTPVDSSGATQGEVKDKTVTFAPLAVLPAQKTAEWRIKAEGVKAGDGRVTVQISSDTIPRPVTQEESTHVY